ncbi:GGDEF domain-containing protein [Pseudidiomarina sp. 1APP75-27a]|uniref:GGDEF domain-containing protein n=1 Tax=Pseudidiomarina terrestris TaxID=2820060 RepID=UPI00264C3633|nr:MULTISPECIES: GGDEF domain-containing protein [unclassified Pseudidiomarina]MDN7138214.1 GGDEF domain-containing protein [Pseudidiomarina sp. 1ASP75-14]MEA3588011.1 GGDEF domain-containing protein [Pseudidiomarina sp. 1APP75-27a]
MPHSLLTYTDQSAHHQSQLLRAVLKIIALFSVIIGSINVFVFASYDTALFNYVSFAVASGLLLYFRNHRQLILTSWLACAAVIFNVMVFIHLANGQNYAILWVMIIPPIVFFLLGRKLGAWITGLLFLYVIAFMAIQIQQPMPRALGLGALLNIIEVCVALWFLFRFYEGSRESAYRELEIQSVTDKLTGLYNRIKLDSVVAMQHRQLGTGQVSHSTVVIADIDNFKAINDSLGHIKGDEVLRHAAQLLRDFTRNDGLVGRWGGEEFMLILPGYTLEQAKLYSERLRQYIADNETAFGQTLTMSFGVAALHPKKSFEHTFIEADRALYRAKEEGRNCVRVSND